MPSRPLALHLAFLALATAIGCSGNSGLDISPAKGILQFEGEPVAGATIVFTPATNSDGAQKEAQAETDENGNFEIQTFDGKTYHPGIAPGEYIVTATKLELPKDMRGKPKQLLPKRYRSPTTSTLKATVPPGGESAFEFELEK